MSTRARPTADPDTRPSRRLWTLGTLEHRSTHRATRIFSVPLPEENMTFATPVSTAAVLYTL